MKKILLLIALAAIFVDAKAQQDINFSFNNPYFDTYIYAEAVNSSGTVIGTTSTYGPYNSSNLGTALLYYSNPSDPNSTWSVDPATTCPGCPWTFKYVTVYTTDPCATNTSYTLDLTKTQGVQHAWTNSACAAGGLIEGLQFTITGGGNIVNVSTTNYIGSCPVCVP